MMSKCSSSRQDNGHLGPQAHTAPVHRPSSDSNARHLQRPHSPVSSLSAGPGGGTSACLPGGTSRAITTASKDPCRSGQISWFPHRSGPGPAAPREEINCSVGQGCKQGSTAICFQPDGKTLPQKTVVPKKHRREKPKGGDRSPERERPVTPHRLSSNMPVETGAPGPDRSHQEQLTHACLPHFTLGFLWNHEAGRCSKAQQ